MNEYLKSVPEVLQALRSAPEGLSDQEARDRLLRGTPNQLIAADSPTLWMRFFAQLKNPMIVILIAAALVSGVTAVHEGEPFTDAIIIIAVVIINSVLGVFQENKAERALQALQNMAAPTAKVLREGLRKNIAREHLVPGDVILLEAGDAVPADGRVIESASLQVEEAPLTGESTPVSKFTDPLVNADVSLGDRHNMIYMGSTVVYGRGTAVITQTGMQTEMGKIADALTQAPDHDTPLQKKLNQLSRILSFLVLGICLFLFLFQILRAGENLSGPLVLETFLAAVSLAVAAIPEGLAAVVTIVLSIGVTRMSRERAIIRRLTAVETLGCAQVICSDKTGTLTQNRMTVLATAGHSESLLAAVMSLCSDAEPGEQGQMIGEPTECALVQFASDLGLPKSLLTRLAPRVGEAPFDSERKRMTTLHTITSELRDGSQFPDAAQKEAFTALTANLPASSLLQCTKGAPDEVLRLCTHCWVSAGQTDASTPDCTAAKPPVDSSSAAIRPMTDAMRQSILQENQEFAGKALRVLAAAIRIHPEFPADHSAAALETGLCFVGLSGMMDPVRSEVKIAIAECRQAGIRPIMITGDHKDTAAAIAAELGILTQDTRAITGAELDQIPEGTLPDQVATISVYARVRPEHKVRIVQAWQARGFVTAMTGDGVNDAPSIKNADIGIGMGITGTDVTKNTADMILADDNFATIVSAVKEGRRIYANIRKAIQFLLASNLAEVLAIFLASVLGFTILRPIHLLWINLITDTFPALALGMEAGEIDLMRRPPRDPKEHLFAGGVGPQILYQGVCIMVLTVLAYFTGHYLATGRLEIITSPAGITLAFLTLSITEILHSFNLRSLTRSLYRTDGHNLYLWGAMLASFAATLALLTVPTLTRAFGLTPVGPAECFAAIFIAALIVPLAELGKWVHRRLA